MSPIVSRRSDEHLFMQDPGPSLVGHLPLLLVTLTLFIAGIALFVRFQVDT